MTGTVSHTEPGGRAVACGNFKQIAAVLLVVRTVARLDEVHDAIVAAGGTAYVHPADLSGTERPPSLRAIVSGAGPLDAELVGRLRER
jgi:short-subunit dehydrogenase